MIKESCSFRLKEALRIRNLKQADLCKLTGIPKSAMSQYLSGAFEPKQDRVHAISKALFVDEAWLMGYDVPMEKTDIHFINTYPVGNVINFPVLASVSAGYSGLAEEYTEDDTETIPIDMLGNYPPNECRVLKVTGNSMYPKICDGDKVLIHVQPSVDSGSVAVVIYNGEESTIKTVKYRTGEDWVDLIPTNPEYETKRIENEDLEKCRVFGKVLKLIRDF